MSAARQKSRLLWLAFAAAVVVLSAAPVQSALMPPIAVNPLTGVAIDGFDPVAYFTGEGAVQGRAEFEYELAGVTWRFRSQGNRAAFVDYPEVYAPQFGGYDPVAIARGVSVPGHPMMWAVAGDRLYLFYDAKARADFLEAPRRVIDAARRHWADVKRTLP
jgi:YHS domain-containing protein